MAIIEVRVKIACGEDISEKIMDAIENGGLAEDIARNLACVCDSDNLAVETSGMPSKRLV